MTESVLRSRKESIRIPRDVDLIDLHELESNLVYFATSLRANGVVLDRLTRYGRLRQYSEDQELLEDAIIENRQAIEMTHASIVTSSMVPEN